MCSATEQKYKLLQIPCYKHLFIQSVANLKYIIMILQQYKELLKLRGVEMEKGKTLQTILKQSGGKETEEQK